MSKEQTPKPNLKLMSKEDIDKNRIKSYKYVDMSKEQTPIEVDEFIEQQNLKLKSPMEGYVIPFSQLKSMLEQYAQAKVLEAQNNLIQDIKEKVAKLEENTNTTDFAFDVINLLKSIKPKQR